MRPDGPLVTGLQKLAASLPPDTDMVEVGSWSGESALIWLRSGRVSRLLMVDPFDPLLCGRRPGRAASEKRVARAKTTLQQAVLAHWPNATLLQMHSVDAAKALQFAGRRFDFVYIDGEHSEASVRQDIAAWRPLVKPVGLLGGHDYTGGYLSGVMRAVDDLLGQPDVVYEDTSWVKRL
jgi:hypothetical protein